MYRAFKCMCTGCAGTQKNPCLVVDHLSRKDQLINHFKKLADSLQFRLRIPNNVRPCGEITREECDDRFLKQREEITSLKADLKGMQGEVEGALKAEISMSDRLGGKLLKIKKLKKEISGLKNTNARLRLATPSPGRLIALASHLVSCRDPARGAELMEMADKIAQSIAVPTDPGTQ